MKRIIPVAILVIILINISSLIGDETKCSYVFQLHKQKKFSFFPKIDSFSLLAADDTKGSTRTMQPNADYNFYIKRFPQITKDIIAQFSFEKKDLYAFSLKIPPDMFLISKNKKDYSKTAQEIAGMNATVWVFNRYFMKEAWTNISLKSILSNLKSGFTWDIDKYLTNQLGHPYHGALHYSSARANKLNYFESTICSFLGSIMWEFFLESEGTQYNRPSTNDLMMNTLGGMTLGELLFRTADLLVDESSRGLERVLRESLAFLINPAYGFRAFTGKAFKIGNPPKKHYYSLRFPFGAYRSSLNNKPSFLIAANLEYKDFLKKDLSKINPYDWFTLDCRLGFNNEGLRDKEIFTTGILTGKKLKNGLAGLFGIFDYIDTYAADKISAVGVGPGLVTMSSSDSGLFFNSSGVLSLIMGGSSPSFDVEYSHFGKRVNDPYYLGPGILGRINLELGNKNLGSIRTGFSQYWIHSILSHANEFLGILSCSLQCDLSRRSQISLGYDYYLRHATFEEQRFTGAKPTVRALYVLKF